MLFQVPPPPSQSGSINNNRLNHQPKSLHNDYYNLIIQISGPERIIGNFTGDNHHNPYLMTKSHRRFMLDAMLAAQKHPKLQKITLR
ncbi:hypothetical protein A2U01_0044818, partial [Trifolium medium]|nr:hypothetical protein [Trifolium medium]